MDDKDMSLINSQFDRINTKLDKLTELTEQTHLQEYRLNELEKKLDQIQNGKHEVFWRILTPVLSVVLSAITTYLLSGGLSK